jgi:ankyrin repeat protein
LLLLACAALVACSHEGAWEAADALAVGDLETARALYESGVDPDTLIRGQTALTMAACQGSPEVVGLLLKVGAEPDRPSASGSTPLLRAARCGNLPVVRLLLEAGAEPNPASPNGETALSSAREEGHEAVAELLQEAGAIEAYAERRPRRRLIGY